MNAVMNVYEDGQLVYLSPQEISVVEGFNPRRYFDPAYMKELEDSIRAEGVQQNIVVRPDPDHPGRYLLIAGERRLRAAKSVGMTEIPALVRHVDEKVALQIAMHENDKRQNISPAEEAEKAQNMLNACDGDRDEACKLLGWSRSRFDARLLLLHAHENVLNALAERKIKLGIAELLCGLPKSAQEKNLPVVIEKGYSVAELRQKIESMAQKLATAIFDTKACQGCPHNSSTQASLFDDGLSDGQCMGRSCFAEKTQAAIEERRQSLEGEYNVVFLDVDKPAGSWVNLLAEGKGGVGKEQAEACKGCAKFGALLSTEPGNEGQVIESICFDPLCNAKMVKKAQDAAAESAKTGKSASGKPSASSGKPKSKSSAKKPEVAATPKKVRELSVAFLRAEAAKIPQTDPTTVRALLLYALLKEVGHQTSKIGSTPDKALAYLHGLDDTALEALEIAASEKLLGEFKGNYGEGQEYENAAFTALAITNTNLAGRFTLTREFLEAHTKKGIEALMREARDPSGQSFAEWWEAKRGPFKKLLAKKSGDLIDSILGADFDFSQWVPSCISGEVDKVKASINSTQEKAA